MWHFEAGREWMPVCCCWSWEKQVNQHHSPGCYLIPRIVCYAMLKHRANFVHEMKRKLSLFLSQAYDFWTIDNCNPIFPNIFAIVVAKLKDHSDESKKMHLVYVVSVSFVSLYLLDKMNIKFYSSYIFICAFPYIHWNLLTHYQMTNFRLFRTERVCRRQFQIWWKWQKVIQTGRKHCGKRRNCFLRAISPFPTVSSKGLFPRGIKRCYCVGMG